MDDCRKNNQVSNDKRQKDLYKTNKYKEQDK